LRRAKSYKDSYWNWIQDIWSARGEPLDFKDHKYLVQIYKDQSPHIIIMKSAQAGVSERAISEAVWVCDQLGKNVLYTFPAQGQLNDFVKGRLDPVITGSEYLSARSSRYVVGEKKGDTVARRPERTGLKQFGDGFLYLRGSQNEKQIITIDADMVILDERDRFIPATVPFIDKRLLHSDLKWRRHISTPTIPGWGIHKHFLASDQHQWHIKCDNCNEEQHLEWWRNTKEIKDDKGKKIGVKIICGNCKEDLDRLKDGRWVPKNKGAEARGYHINGLYNPYLNLKDAWTQSKSPDVWGLTQFYNQTLGLPYEPEGARLTQQALDSCARAYDIPFRENGNIVKHGTGGADVGNTIHVVVGKKQKEGESEDDIKTRYLWIGEVNNFFGPQDSLEWVMRTFDLETLVVDIMPETRSVQELCKMFPGRVFGCRYPTRRFSGGYMEWKLDDNEVQVDRTVSLDYYVSEVDTQKIIIPISAESIEGFYDQMKASVRIIDKSSTTGVISAKWQEEGPDHYFHAANYERIARQRGGTSETFLSFYKGDDQEPSEEELHAKSLADIKRLVDDSGVPL
jgi:hypothetical protein